MQTPMLQLMLSSQSQSSSIHIVIPTNGLNQTLIMWRNGVKLSLQNLTDLITHPMVTSPRIT